MMKLVMMVKIMVLRHAHSSGGDDNGDGDDETMNHSLNILMQGSAARLPQQH